MAKGFNDEERRHASDAYAAWKGREWRLVVLVVGGGGGGAAGGYGLLRMKTQ